MWAPVITVVVALLGGIAISVALLWELADQEKV